MTLAFDPARLARIGRHFDETYVAPGKLAGVDIAVWRRGEVAYRHISGFADAERGKPVGEDALWRIYSTTKPITSVAFMMLVEDGRVDLGDPVTRYIPSWSRLKTLEGEPARPMRVVDLLRHTSGLTYGFQNNDAADAAYRAAKIGEPGGPKTLADFVEVLADLPLVFQPGGEAWNYSVSTDVVGRLIEIVSGETLDDFLTTRVLRPLGMDDTGFSVPADRAHRLTACYQTLPDGSRAVQDDPQTSAFLRPPTFLSGGGGLVSTTADILKFCRMVLGRGALDGARLIAPKTLDLMAANHIPGGKDIAEVSTPSMFSEAAYAGVGFGLGFATTTDVARTLMPGSVGDLFWGGMASTYFWIDPAEDMAVVQMAQSMPSSLYPIRRELRTLVYSSLV
jgi:CubicO group peptidase (beta-lactamase class C family)